MMGTWLKAHGGRRMWALGCAAAVLAVLMFALPQAGITDDDDFYAPAATSYIRWVGRAFTFQSGAWSRGAVDSAFDANHEHPPMAKYVMGAAWWVLSDSLRVLPSLDGARAGVSLLAALLAFVVASYGFMLRGRAGAVLATAFLFFLPRFFFHSRVATLDVPVASLTTLAGYLAWRGRRSIPHAWAAGIGFGAALLTKLNAPFLLVALVAHWSLRGLRRVRVESGRLVVPPLPMTLPWMVVCGPVMFFLLWPHMWFDTVNRVGAYLAFHLNHYPIYLYYFGDLYTQTIPPWHMPWVMAAGVTPVLVLALMVAGVLLAVRALWTELGVPLAQDEDVLETGDGELDSLRAFLLIQAFIAIGVVSFTGVPKYGGEKLFMPVFPLLAILAVDGAALVGLGLGRPVKGLELQGTLAAGGLAVMHALMATWHAGAYPLSYYSEALLGVRGAEALGMETTYYDVADKTLTSWMNTNAPNGARVHFEPNHKEYVRTWNWLARDGYLRRDIQTAEENAADFVVLTHERRWSTYPALAQRLESLPVVYEATLDGVRLYTVYKRR